VDQVIVNALEVKKPEDIFKSAARGSVEGVKAQYTGHIQTH